jgi:predicted site-specific integrase-resolvase
MIGWGRIKQISDYTGGTSVRTIRKWLKSGLKHSRLPSGTIYINYKDVDEYMRQFEVNENALDVMVDEIVKDLKN